MKERLERKKREDKKAQTSPKIEGADERMLGRGGGGRKGEGQRRKTSLSTSVDDLDKSMLGSVINL